MRPGTPKIALFVTDTLQKWAGSTGQTVLDWHSGIYAPLSTRTDKRPRLPYTRSPSSSGCKYMVQTKDKPGNEYNTRNLIDLALRKNAATCYWPNLNHNHVRSPTSLPQSFDTTHRRKRHRVWCDRFTRNLWSWWPQVLLWRSVREALQRQPW